MWCAPAAAGCSAIEPLVEVETAEGRIGYGPVDAGRGRPPCSTAATRTGSAMSRTLPFFARQQRFTFARCGIIDPLSLRRL